MTRPEIRDLVIKAVAGTDELTNIVDIIFKEIGNAYDKGFNQGKYDPDFDNDEEANINID